MVPDDHSRFSGRKSPEQRDTAPDGRLNIFSLAMPMQLMMSLSKCAPTDEQIAFCSTRAALPSGSTSR